MKKDSFRPIHYSDDPKRRPSEQQIPITNQDGRHSKDSILAMSIAKMVFKQGRKTVPPDQFLRDSGLLPSGFELQSSNDEKSASNESASSQHGDIARIIEERRLRGLEIARHLNGLDDGISIFDVREPVAFSKL